MGKKFATGMLALLGMAWANTTAAQQTEFETQGQKFNTLLYYMDSSMWRIPIWNPS